jgi:hypothetical protein
MGFTESTTTTKGQPLYNTDPQTRADLQKSVEFAAEIGNRKVGTAADRDALSGNKVWDGLSFWATDERKEWVRDGGAWRPATMLQITESTAASGGGGPIPANAVPITKLHFVEAVTDSQGRVPFTFPTAFPARAAHIFYSVFSGTGVNPVTNAGQLSRTGATAVFAGVPGTTVKFSYMAYGW